MPLPFTNDLTMWSPISLFENTTYFPYIHFDHPLTHRVLTDISAKETLDNYLGSPLQMMPNTNTMTPSSDNYDPLESGCLLCQHAGTLTKYKQLPPLSYSASIASSISSKKSSSSSPATVLSSTAAAQPLSWYHQEKLQLPSATSTAMTASQTNNDCHLRHHHHHPLHLQCRHQYSHRPLEGEHTIIVTPTSTISSSAASWRSARSSCCCCHSPARPLGRHHSQCHHRYCSTCRTNVTPNHCKRFTFLQKCWIWWRSLISFKKRYIYPMNKRKLQMFVHR